jgi:hypothetical protein
MTSISRQEPRSAIENESGVRILLSRMQGPLPDGSDPAQYQYVFLRGSERVGFLGLSGGEDHYRFEPRRESTYSLDLTREVTLRSMLRQKPVFTSTEGDFEFICSLAYGLLFSANEGGSSQEDVRHIAITTLDAIRGVGIPSLPPDVVSSNGTVILAEIFTPGTDA